MSNVVSINQRLERKIERLLASIPEDVVVRIAKHFAKIEKMKRDDDV